MGDGSEGNSKPSIGGLSVGIICRYLSIVLSFLWPEFFLCDSTRVGKSYLVMYDVFGFILCDVFLMYEVGELFVCEAVFHAKDKEDLPTRTQCLFVL